MKGEKIKRNRKWIVSGLWMLALCINMGLFPILPLQAEYPVELGVLFRMMVLAMACAAHIYIGAAEAVLFAHGSVWRMGWMNMGMVLCGLVCRYWLEFGEASNTYNFTGGNALFQIATLATISTVVYWWKKRALSAVHPADS